ncbi:META domain-containing protein [Paraburkholderia sartisoli]|uniref:META domain-containing protein n=1 Tax=Paraburkholderia sartisoli TaxID=83784 RepID=A0A1H4C4P6_9BURK|nr:META domain-containing protein [Paraburkholderia sartisoli]SEA55346.1 META domain-containing protein [Paraburkholderia sartisoli]
MALRSFARHHALSVAPLLARVRASFQGFGASGFIARAASGSPWRAPVAALCLTGLVTACSLPVHTDASAEAPDPFNPAATQLLDNTTWELTSWKQADGTLRDVPHGDNGEPVTLTLSTANGQRRASGFSGCNRYMGTYALKDGKLSFGPLAGTRMACATLGGQIEGAYLDALAHIDRTGVQMRAPQELQLIPDNGDTLTFARRGQ